MTTNPERWWFSIWHSAKFANGWVFGATAEDAARAAFAQVPAVSLLGRNPMITLQQDVSPAVYADFKVSQFTRTT